MARHSRRQFLQSGLTLAGLGLGFGCGVRAPSSGAAAPPPRIAVVNGRSEIDAVPHTQAFRQGLGEYGYEEGRNIAIEWRFLDGRAERSPEVVQELLSLGVAAIVTGNPQFAPAAKRATSTVPIILAGVGGDLVALGLVDSLSRPGGNVTGLSLAVPTLSAKRLQLLKETAPGVDRIGLLWDGTLGPAFTPRMKALEDTGASLGVEVRTFWIQRPEELEAAFEAMGRDGVGALHVVETALTAMLAGRIAQLALQHRLPVMYPTPEFMREGGLMALGVDQADLYRRAAGYVHKILRGADPAEVPVEQPTKFEFVINLKAAQALGLTIPPSVLLQATQVI